MSEVDAFTTSSPVPAWARTVRPNNWWIGPEDRGSEVERAANEKIFQTVVAGDYQYSYHFKHSFMISADHADKFDWKFIPARYLDPKATDWGISNLKVLERRHWLDVGFYPIPDHLATPDTVFFKSQDTTRVKRPVDQRRPGRGPCKPLWEYKTENVLLRPYFFVGTENHPRDCQRGGLFIRMHKTKDGRIGEKNAHSALVPLQDLVYLEEYFAPVEKSTRMVEDHTPAGLKAPLPNLPRMFVGLKPLLPGQVENQYEVRRKAEHEQAKAELRAFADQLAASGNATTGNATTGNVARGATLWNFAPIRFAQIVVEPDRV